MLLQIPRTKTDTTSKQLHILPCAKTPSSYGICLFQNWASQKACTEEKKNSLWVEGKQLGSKIFRHSPDQRQKTWSSNLFSLILSTDSQKNMVLIKGYSNFSSNTWGILGNKLILLSSNIRYWRHIQLEWRMSAIRIGDILEQRNKELGNQDPPIHLSNGAKKSRTKQISALHI